MLKEREEFGVSLVELLVGIAVGLIVTAGVLAVYVAIARSSLEIFASSKLNEELRGAMDIMVRDIRRAGAWVPDDSSEKTKISNPYTTDSSPVTNIKISPNGQCIEFAYDASFMDGNSTPDEAYDFFGYKYTSTSDGKAVAVRWQWTSDTACVTDAIGADWRRLTDEKNVVVENLSFSSTGSICFNSNKPISVDAPQNPWKVPDTSPPALYWPCDSSAPNYNASPGDRLIEKRQVTINLNGRMKSKSVEDFKVELLQIVRIANDRIVLAP